MINLLLDRGAKIDMQRDVSGETALMWGIEMYKVKAGRALLDRHANIRIKDNKGHTALFVAKSLYASNLKKTKIIQMLKQAGAKE